MNRTFIFSAISMASPVSAIEPNPAAAVGGRE
jgi:hypothetical protein